MAVVTRLIRVVTVNLHDPSIRWSFEAIRWSFEAMRLIKYITTSLAEDP